jgi:hypothetical protein
MRRFITLLLSAALLALLALPAAASARSKDRDHDKMPDRWERAHKLDTRHNDARRDADGDGVKNLSEYRTGLDPRDDDTDDDGTDDGAEHAGTVASFSGGILVVKLLSGKEIEGRVTDDTEIECDGAGFGTARSASRGDDGENRSGRRGDDDDDDDEAGDDKGGRRPAGVSDDGDDDDRGRDADDDENRCATTELRPGTAVHEAELELREGEAVWEEVELFR